MTVFRMMMIMMMRKIMRAENKIGGDNEEESWQIGEARLQSECCLWDGSREREDYSV